MKELIIPLVIFTIWTLFSIIYIIRFRHRQLNITANKRSFWNNQYIFESIPPVFPTLGIFCTALGITIGIWDFNTADIQGSIPLLLKGLRIAFIATMAGIIGLIIFQKYIAIIQKQIDEDPNKPKKQTDELSALSELSFAIDSLKQDNQKQIDKLIKSFGDNLENKIGLKISSLEKQVITLKENNAELPKLLDKASKANENALKEVSNSFKQEIEILRQEQNSSADKADKNVLEIIKAMSENNTHTTKKFDEFSELLRKNNTEALVQVMKSATEQFNAQMSELINRLIQENFQELNNSVKSLNDWQKENKQQIYALTENFKKTSEMFTISAITLKEVANNTKALTEDNGKLEQLVRELKRVMIEDGKFQEITNKLTETIDTLQETTESFEETTDKLNDWVRTEKSLKDAAQILIVKLEEFRDFNGDVWERYRKEMQKSVSIVSETSKRLGEDLENVNAEFYERLNDTLSNLDMCIQRFIPANRR